MQTVAALLSGRSGGALADAHDRVVGINAAVAGIGLGLAIPVNSTTRRIIASLMRDGRVRRAYLGLITTPAPLPPKFRESGRSGRGVRVAEVVPGGPADRAGLRAGDLLLYAAGQPLDSAQALQRLMFAEAIGRPFAITAFPNRPLGHVITEPAELVGA